MDLASNVSFGFENVKRLGEGSAATNWGPRSDASGFVCNRFGRIGDPWSQHNATR
jgi:hypothetical protein